MLTKNTGRERGQIQMVTIDDLVPSDHFVRDLDKSLDFSFIYPLVENMYCDDNGRPSVDPVVLFKLLFVQYTFGIRSLRQTVREVQTNMAYKWFVGLDMLDKVPHFSTVGKNYERRFKGTKIFEQIFAHILKNAVDCGFVDSSAIFIDSTHIKASANKKKKVEAFVNKEAKKCKYQLDEEIRKDREEHDKKFLKDDDNEPPKKITKSSTDPECGEFHKGEHEKQFAYSAHTACDKNNFILSAVVTPANLHDSTVFDEVYKVTTNQFPQTKAVVVDAGYKTPWIAKQILDDNRQPIMPYKRPMTKKGYFKKYEYVYDEYYDCYICPNGENLNYTTTNRNGYKEYKSNSKTCQLCLQRKQCTANIKFQKLVTRHVWEHYLEEAEHIRHTDIGKALYSKRSETIERVFADAKEKHGMRYTNLRGLKKVTASINLIFACMNLKKLAKWKHKNGFFSLYFCKITTLISYFIKKLHQKEKTTQLLMA